MISTTRMKCWKKGLLMAAVMLLPALSWAGDFYSTVPYIGSVKLGGTGATPANQVFGKEYSHNRPSTAASPNIVSIDDHDSFGVPDPLQVVSWDGIPRAGVPGGNSGSTNGFDYDSAVLGNTTRQVDAIANRGDFLFKEVIANQASLLFSTTLDIRVPGPDVHIMWEDPTGGFGPWAVIETISTSHPPGPGPGVNHHDVFDVDGLEVWGPEPPSHTNPNADPVVEGYIGAANTADSDRFSLDIDSGSGVSVWGYDIPTSTVFAWAPHAAIVAAVEAAFLPAGALYPPEIRDMIDLDALMAQDTNIVGPTRSSFGVGDELLFSIDPIPQVGIDGGEIIHLVVTAAGISGTFLSHGGHLWDTAFDVRGKFGTEFEDIDVLEAVGTLTGDFEIPVPDPLIPEPSTWVLALFAFGGVMIRRSRLNA